METFYETTSDGAGGANCISGNFYEKIQQVLKIFFEHDVCDGVTYAQHTKRKTVAAMDEDLDGVNY